MNELNAIAAKKDNLVKANVKIMSFTEIMKDKEFLHSGESRGIPFTLIKGEVLKFEDLDKASFFWSTFLGRDKKEHKVYKTIAFSSIRGAIEFPLAKLCYAPSLESEQDLLFSNGNDLGRLLANTTNDPQRITIVAGHTVEVYDRLNLHQDYFTEDPETHTLTRVRDSEDLAKRKDLICFRLKFTD